jgi:hypothetical protein
MAANPYVRPTIAMIPSILRMLQCLRRYRDTRSRDQLWNAGKYSSSLFVSIFSALRGGYPLIYVFLVLWLLSIIISTIYNVYWDVFRDWGLGDKKYRYLRKEKLYENWVSNQPGKKGWQKEWRLRKTLFCLLF